MFTHQSSDSTQGFTALRRHGEYYLPGGDLFFLIEQTHFRVHSYFFERESQIFKQHLATPASPGATRQGTSESTAIVLDDVKAANFAKLLWVFYNPKYSLYKARVEDWVAIMELAYEWGFHEVMKLATREIERLEMPDIDRIVAYHDFDIDRSLLLHRYAALTAREEPLTWEEGMALGMETTLKIFQAREVARAPRTANGSRSPISATLPANEMQSLILDIFELPEYSEPPRDDDEPPRPQIARQMVSPDKIVHPATPVNHSFTLASSFPIKPESIPTLTLKTTNAWSSAVGIAARANNAWGASANPSADTSPVSTEREDGVKDVDKEINSNLDKDENGKATAGGLVIHSDTKSIADVTESSLSGQQLRPTIQVDSVLATSPGAFSPLPLPIQLTMATRAGQAKGMETDVQRPLSPPPISGPPKSLVVPLPSETAKERQEIKLSIPYAHSNSGVDEESSDSASDEFSDDETRVDSDEHGHFHETLTTEELERVKDKGLVRNRGQDDADPKEDVGEDETTQIARSSTEVPWRDSISVTEFSGNNVLEDKQGITNTVIKDNDAAPDAHAESDSCSEEILANAGASITFPPSHSQENIRSALDADSVVLPLTESFLPARNESTVAIDDTDQKALGTLLDEPGASLAESQERDVTTSTNVGLEEFDRDHSINDVEDPLVEDTDESVREHLSKASDLSFVNIVEHSVKVEADAVDDAEQSFDAPTSATDTEDDLQPDKQSSVTEPGTPSDSGMQLSFGEREILGLEDKGGETSASEVQPISLDEGVQLLSDSSSAPPDDSFDAAAQTVTNQSHQGMVTNTEMEKQAISEPLPHAPEALIALPSDTVVREVATDEDREPNLTELEGPIAIDTPSADSTKSETMTDVEASTSSTKESITNEQLSVAPEASEVTVLPSITGALDEEEDVSPASGDTKGGFETPFDNISSTPETEKQADDSDAHPNNVTTSAPDPDAMDTFPTSESGEKQEVVKNSETEKSHSQDNVGINESEDIGGSVDAVFTAPEDETASFVATPFTESVTAQQADTSSEPTTAESNINSFAFSFDGHFQLGDNSSTVNSTENSTQDESGAPEAKDESPAKDYSQLLDAASNESTADTRETVNNLDLSMFDDENEPPAKDYSQLLDAASNEATADARETVNNLDLSVFDDENEPPAKDYSQLLDAASNESTADIRETVNNLDLSMFDDENFDSPEEPHDEASFFTAK